MSCLNPLSFQKNTSSYTWLNTTAQMQIWSFVCDSLFQLFPSAGFRAGNFTGPFEKCPGQSHVHPCVSARREWYLLHIWAGPHHITRGGLTGSSVSHQVKLLKSIEWKTILFLLFLLPTVCRSHTVFFYSINPVKRGKKVCQYVWLTVTHNITPYLTRCVCLCMVKRDLLQIRCLYASLFQQKHCDFPKMSFLKLALL